MNIGELLELGRKELNKIEDGNLKAKILLEHITNKKREYIVANHKETICEEIVKKYLKNIEKIKSGFPIQYITKKQEFMKLNFYVDENVLIPQPDTEILVEETIKICKKYEGKIKILDICTGSGAIGISIAKNIENSIVYCSDISEKALEIAKKNAVNNNVENIDFILSDMFKNIVTKEFDIIVSNPPYIETDTINKLPKEVKCEPTIALDGGTDGLKFYKKIINNYTKYLKKDGYLILEIGYNQAEQLQTLLGDIKIVKDIAGNNRVIIKGSE